VNRERFIRPSPGFDGLYQNLEEVQGLRSLATRDDLRHADVYENQKLLIRGFGEARDPSATIIILDGHVVVHGPEGLSAIGSSVFSALGVSIIAHLEADPSLIFTNRNRDPNRDRPRLAVSELDAHQKQSLAQARRISKELKIELMRLAHDDASKFCQYLSELN
jgi:adenylate kinase